VGSIGVTVPYLVKIGQVIAAEIQRFRGGFFNMAAVRHLGFVGCGSLCVCVCVVNEAIEMPVAFVNSWAQGFVCLLMGARVAYGNGHVWGHRSRIRGVPFQNSHKFKNFTSSKKHVNIRKKIIKGYEF